MAQQEGNSDLSTTFSTLNVNAMEFVPSFCSNVQSPAAASATAASGDASVEAVTPDQAPTPKEESLTKTDEDQPATVVVPTEPIDDKSPDNPGS